jgi:hypothetical protein
MAGSNDAHFFIKITPRPEGFSFPLASATRQTVCCAILRALLREQFEREVLRDRDNRHPSHHRSAERGGEGRRTSPPESTNREVEYIKYLIEKEIPVVVRLADNQEVTGVIEYYDQSFIRLTRRNQPNLFIFKQEIKYLYELSNDSRKTQR